MTRLATCLILALMIVVTSGCTAYRHHQAGDEAAQAGDMRLAAYHYKRAMMHDGSLRSDPAFQTKLTVAEARVAYSEALKLRSIGEYEKAIDQLRLAMQKDPNYTQPGELLPAVLKEATRWRYDRALQAADEGSLKLAETHLRRALSHDPLNEDVATALASLTPEKLSPTTPGLAVYRAGVGLSAERRWMKAEAQLVQAVAANSGLLPARVALHTARAKLTEARGLTQSGAVNINGRRIGPAIEALNQSLAIWPYDARPARLLEQAKTLRAEADKRLAEANKASAAREWDKAIAQADAGLSIDRSHKGLNTLRGQLAGRAAADYTSRGDGLLAKGDMPGAKAAYERALGYAVNYRPARNGLVAVYAAWGTQHEQAGRFGAAYMHYAKAASLQSTKPIIAGMSRTKAAVKARLDIQLGVSVAGAQQAEVGPAMLTDALTGHLAKHRGAGLGVNGQNPAYTLRVTIRGGTISEKLVGSVRKTHRYSTREKRLNAEFDRVAARLEQERCTYDLYCKEYHREVGFAHSRHHQGHGHCANANRLYSRIQRQKRVVDRWSRTLSHTPRFIYVTVFHNWDYTVQTFQKTGQLVAATQLIDNATGKAIATTASQADYAATDSQVLNPNPAVGVRPDGLTLPSDGQVRQSLSSDLAGQAGLWAVDAAVQHRFNSIKAQVKALREAGKEAQAVELEVDCAVLLGIVDPKGSAKLLDTLTKRHTP